MGIREELAAQNRDQFLPDLATSFNNYANCLAAAGRPDEAMEHYQAALKISREIGDRRGEASNLANLGLLALQSGDLTEAGALLTASLAIAQEIEDPAIIGPVEAALDEVRRRRDRRKPGSRGTRVTR